MKNRVRIPLDRLSRKLAQPSDFETIKGCFTLLSQIEIRRLKLVSSAQLLLAFLDFAGVLAIGLIGMLSVYGIQSRSPSGQLKWFLELLNIESWTLQSQVAIVGTFAGLLLVSKSLISATINRRTISFLANRSADISMRILRRLIFSNVEQIKRRTRFENIFAVTSGVQSITVGVIGTMVNLFADSILIFVMFVGLLAIDASIAISTVTLFGSIAYFLYRLVNKRVAELAALDATIQIRNNQLLYELLGSYREIFAGGVRHRYLKGIEDLRRQGAAVSAKLTFIPSVSKYVLEISFVFGALLFIGFQFIFKDAVGAISSISIFVASAGRVIPAILRIQTALLTFKGSLSGASRTLEIMRELEEIESQGDFEIAPVEKHGIFSAKINVQDVTFSYENNEAKVLTNVNLEISEGEWIAIVGPSGAGKTTLVDLILGILKPSEGLVLVSGLDAEVAVSKWPGMVSYVPQDIFLNQGSIEQNIALGVDPRDLDHETIVECLNRVGLKNLISENEFGTKRDIGELGSRLSGGQRQRLGIARALYTKPRLLILDEATSSLDTKSEKTIIDCLNELRGDVTIISIAHRLSTVVNADQVIYIEAGKIIAKGSFDEVRDAVPNFDEQAKLARFEA